MPIETFQNYSNFTNDVTANTLYVTSRILSSNTDVGQIISTSIGTSPLYTTVNTNSANWVNTNTTKFDTVTALGFNKPFGYAEFKDDFLGGTNTSGDIGELGWSQKNFTSTGSFGYTNDASAFGTFYIRTAATLSAASGLYFAYSGSPQINAVNTAIFDMWFRVKIDDINNVAVYLGFLHNISVFPSLDIGAYTNSKGYFIRYDTSLTIPDTQWTLCTCVSAPAPGATKVFNSTFTGAISANVYYSIQMYGNGSGNIFANLYDSSGVQIGTTAQVVSQDLTNYHYIYYAISNKTAATRQLNIDYFGLTIKLQR